MVGVMTKVKSPMLIDKVFDEENFTNLKTLFNNPKSYIYQDGFSRWIANDVLVPKINDYAESLIPLAREKFESTGLLPTYALFSHYEGPKARLHKHKDDNACTYTIDMCVYQKHSWDLFVEGSAYTLQPNQALAYYGNDQEHWREEFPNPDTNHVAMIFFHFAEPNHWWFTKGPNYLSVIRGQISEEDWAKQQGL
jgi:hypothetical protein